MKRPSVLFVLSEEQREAFRTDFDGIEHEGLEFVHRGSPEDALDELATLQPDLVVVGMEVEMMEGLEFLALLVKRHPTFERPVIVLPAKGDPFPPVVHQRDLATGRSMTENIELDTVKALLAEVGQAPGPAPAEVPVASGTAPAAATPEPAAPAPEPAAPAPEPAAPAPEPVAAATQPQPAATFDEAPAHVSFPDPPISTVPDEPGRLLAAEPTQRPRWPLLVGLLAVAAAALVLAVMIFTRDTARHPDTEPAAAAPDTGDTRATASKPAVKAPIADATAREAPRADAAATATESAQPTPVPAAMKQLQTLPLRFAAGEASCAPPDAETRALIARFRSIAAQHPSARIEVGGHTSEEGTRKLNRQLGRLRAQKVKRLLVDAGISADRLVIKNYLSTRPAASNDSVEGRTQNRRVTLRLLVR